jgi:hypothetical protein
MLEITVLAWTVVWVAALGVSGVLTAPPHPERISSKNAK